jgi:dihydroxy-acid dehydratase
MASLTGQRIVELVWEDLKPLDILTPASFDNAVTTVLALSGSTNAIVHLIAMARRAGYELTLDRFDALAKRTPVLANLRPAGKYLMEDFYYAGGLRALLLQLGDLLDASQRTMDGTTLAENIAGARIFNDDVIRTRETALVASDSLAVLRGNLAPDGAVIKPAAADPKLLVHRGRAVVFWDYNDLAARIDDPALEVDADSVIVLQNAGPLGAPGMPEWGQLPIPQKLLTQGVRDMVRISDARMSGTSYGACVLHVTPESFIGGPLALVRTGDLIELDVPARKLNLLVSEAELAERRRAWQPPPSRFDRGYGKLFSEHVTQADKGCDFDFLEPLPAQRSGADPEIH